MPVLPTRVGMVRSRWPQTAFARCAPHPRGDGPVTVAGIELVDPCSPPAWGWSVSPAEIQIQLIVLPTRVGMVRLSIHPPAGSNSAPHPRGDGPQRAECIDEEQWCSPPAWGWSARWSCLLPAPRVLPTRVGMVRYKRRALRPMASAPHPRGDGPRAQLREQRWQQCSPPAWGWSDFDEINRRHFGVLPTRVGMVRSSCVWRWL